MTGLLATRWVRPAPALVTAWVLQDATVPVASVDWSDPQPVAAVIGPPGPAGPLIDIFTLPLAPG